MDEFAGRSTTLAVYARSPSGFLPLKENNLSLDPGGIPGSSSKRERVSL